MEFECLLPLLQEHDIGSNYEPHDFTTHSKILFLSETFEYYPPILVQNHLTSSTGDPEKIL